MNNQEEEEGKWTFGPSIRGIPKLVPEPSPAQSSPGLKIPPAPLRGLRGQVLPLISLSGRQGVREIEIFISVKKWNHQEIPLLDALWLLLEGLTESE